MLVAQKVLRHADGIYDDMHNDQGPQIATHRQETPSEQKTHCRDLNYSSQTLVSVTQPEDNRADGQGDCPSKLCVLPWRSMSRFMR